MKRKTDIEIDGKAYQKNKSIKLISAFDLIDELDDDEEEFDFDREESGLNKLSSTHAHKNKKLMSVLHSRNPIESLESESSSESDESDQESQALMTPTPHK